MCPLFPTLLEPIKKRAAPYPHAITTLYTIVTPRLFPLTVTSGMHGGAVGRVSDLCFIGRTSGVFYVCLRLADLLPL
jgi:hypothetical protein